MASDPMLALPPVTVAVECRDEKVRKLARSESQHVQQNAQPLESRIINRSKWMYCPLRSNVERKK